MKNNYFAKILLIASIALTGMAACRSNKKEAPAAHPGAHQVNTIDSITARLTRPVNAQVVSGISAIVADSGRRSFWVEVNGVVTYDTRRQTSIASRIGGRIERLLIKYNFQPVRNGQLIMEIYSPDLVAAQRELLLVAKENDGMAERAKQRLILLGMQPSQVEQVLKTGEVFYRVPVYSNANGYILEKSLATTGVALPAATPPSSPSGSGGMGSMDGGGATPATQARAASANTQVMIREGQYVSAGQSLFTIYEADDLIAEFSFPQQLASLIRRGQELRFYPTQNRDVSQSGRIGLIEPVFRNGQNFMVGRIYLDNKNLPVGQFLTATLLLDDVRGWYLPGQAVWRSGNRTIIFKKEKDLYIPMEVKAGIEAEGMVQISTDITGWQIASNAAYLVDSESFIRTTKTTQD